MNRLFLVAAFAAGSCGLMLLPATSRGEEAAKTDEKKPGDRAAGESPSAATLFDQLDTKHTGKISRDDLSEDKRRLFARLLRKAGKAEDAALTKDEFIAAMKEDKPAEQPAGRSTPGEGRADPERMFKFLDRNGDGKLSPDELPEQFKERFGAMLKRAGKSADATLTKEEFLKFMAQQGPAATPGGSPSSSPSSSPSTPNAASGDPDPRKAMTAIALFKALDANGDGELSSSEIAAAPDVLKQLAGKEGRITAASLMGDRAISGGPRKPEAATDSNKPAGENAERPNVERMVKGLLRRMDKNGDGKLSKEEAPEFLREHFDVMDSNKDGQLDENELRQALSREAFGRVLREKLGAGRPDGAKRTDSDKKPETK